MMRFSQYLLALFLVLTLDPAQAEGVNTCLPYKTLPKDVVLSSTKIVFAHYFNRFPLSIDNKEWVNDYYTKQYLNPNGENNKWLAQGGMLRTRPIPTKPSDNNRFKIENLKKEIQMAISRGIGGFTYDILSLDDLKSDGLLENMISAAQEVDPRFKIVIMPDMASFGAKPDIVVEIVKKVYDWKSLYRFEDGRLVVSPFLSEKLAPSEWASVKQQLDVEGYKIAFIPTFLSISRERAEQYKSVSDGFATFGTPVPGQGKGIESATIYLKEMSYPFMAGIGTQGYRPKNYSFWESEGSLAFRESWEGAIRSNPAWVQLTTWNDYGETTQVAPYADQAGNINAGYYDLNGYYASWYLTGKEPIIERDALYYFYRKHSYEATTPLAGQKTTNQPKHIQGKDIIELVAFLKEPAKLTISIGTDRFVKDVSRGVQSFVIPLKPGNPVFGIERLGQKALSVEGDVPISGLREAPSGYADLTYWAGGGAGISNCRIDVE